MLENVPAAIGKALRSIRPGFEKTVYAQAAFDVPETLRLTSEAFSDGGSLPARFTADGAKVSPPLRFQAVPATAKSLALIVEDADSPTPSPLCHALVWSIPVGESAFSEGAIDGSATPSVRHDATLGKNSFMGSGWLPPDPPNGHGAHRYVFQIYALDIVPNLETGAGRGAVVQALTNHVLAKGVLIGTYERT